MTEKAKPALICVPDECVNSDDAGGCIVDAKRGKKCLLPRRGG